MTRRVLQRCVGLSMAAIAAASLMACTRSKQEVAAEHDAVVNKYCGECHSAAEQEGGLVLEHPQRLLGCRRRLAFLSSYLRVLPAETSTDNSHVLPGAVPLNRVRFA